MEKTVALFDMPYQWIFPVIFIVMTATIAICFMKYVILADDKDDEESEEIAPTQASEKSEEKDSK